MLYVRLLNWTSSDVCADTDEVVCVFFTATSFSVFLRLCWSEWNARGWPWTSRNSGGKVCASLSLIHGACWQYGQYISWASESLVLRYGSYRPTQCNEGLLARTSFSMVWSSCVLDTFLCVFRCWCDGWQTLVLHRIITLIIAVVMFRKLPLNAL